MQRPPQQLEGPCAARWIGYPVSMSGQAQNQKVGAALLWLSSLGLAGAGALLSLGSGGHAASEPVLDTVHGFAASPCVSLRQRSGAAMGEELRVAALRLGLRWTELGYEVRIPDPARAASKEEAGALHVAQQELLFGTLGEPATDDAELERRAWRSLGLEAQTGAWVAPDGRAWPRKSSILSVTLVQGNLDSAVRRLSLLGLNESVQSDAALVTLLLQDAGSPELAIPALESPSSSPGVVLWSGGQRVFEVDFDEHGFATERARSYAEVPAEPSKTAAYAELAGSAARYSEAIRSLGRKPISELPLQVAEIASVDAYLRDGALQRCGWYDALRHRLIVVPGLLASADDAVEDYLGTELLRTFGRPASPWLLRGLIYVFTERAGGFSLTELESRSQAAALEDVLAPTRRQPRLALAPAEARLARGVLAEFDGEFASAWASRLEDGDGMVERLRSQWHADLVRAPVAPAPAPKRKWSGGVTVEIASPARGPGQLGSAELHADFQRIASLGFDGVRLLVHVPVAPPTSLERRGALFSLKGWGYGVTLEGDGALLISAAAARALGLSVVIEPRFVASATGALGYRQIHGSPERIRLYGARRALAVEGVAWLAEQAGAEALVMFDPEELPRAVVGSFAAIKEQAEVARAINREQSTVYASPFTGERIAFARSLTHMKRALRAGEFTATAPGAAALTSVGLELTLDSMGSSKDRSRRVLLASREAGGELRALRILGLDPSALLGEQMAWTVLSSLPTRAEAMPHAVLLWPWHMLSQGPVRAGSSPGNLRELPDEKLRQLAVLPR